MCVCVFQVWRWALQHTSPSSQKELARPSLRCISQRQAQERRFVTLRSSITTITPTLSSTRLFNRYSTVGLCLKPINIRTGEIVHNNTSNQSIFILVSFQGNMAISVTHGGDPIPKSPFHITVAPALDIGKVKVEGLDTSKLPQYHYCIYQIKIVNCKGVSVSC